MNPIIASLALSVNVTDPECSMFTRFHLCFVGLSVWLVGVRA